MTNESPRASTASTTPRPRHLPSRFAAVALALAVLLVAPTEVSAEDDEDRFYNRDSLLAGATVHSFAGDVGGIDPFYGVGFKWDTFSDFQGVEGLEDKTIWEFIGLGLTVYYFQGLTPFDAELETGTQTTLEFEASAFQVGILATLIYLPGDLFHPYLGIGFAWTEYSADEETEELSGSGVFPMLDVNIGSRLDLNDTFFFDLSLYANVGRDSFIGLPEDQTILFFTTFLGFGVNVI